MTTRNTGLSKRIRGALARGPATTKELAGALDVEEREVSSLIGQLILRTETVCALRDGTYPVRYALTERGAKELRAVAYVSHQSAKPQENPRPTCPHCSSKYVMRRRDDLNRSAYTCKKCNAEFYVAVLSEKPAALAKPMKASGVIGLPVREREFKPLKRDPFAHMKLAMATRR